MERPAGDGGKREEESVDSQVDTATSGSVEWPPLADALAEVYGADTPARCVQAALGMAADVLGASFLLVLLLDEEEQALSAAHLTEIDHVRVRRVITALGQDPAELLLPVDGERAAILQADGPTVTESFRPLFEGFVGQEHCEEAERDLSIRTVVSLPLVAKGTRFGIASLWYRHATPDLEAAGKLVRHLSLALWAHRAVDQARKLGNVDAETWVYHRRYLYEAGRREVHRARTFDRRVSVALLDLMDMESFQEQYGRTLAAKVLRGVATKLASAASPLDVVARYDDRQFALVFPETERDAAVERVRRLIDDLSSDEDLLPVQDAGEMRIGAAVAAYPDDGGTLDALLRAARQELPDADAEGEAESAGRRAA